jgi:hypothetical protein
VISTEGFKDSPYFCAKNYEGSKSKPILKEGAIYVRDHAAKTVLAAGPEHWNAILKQVLARKQTEFVENLKVLLGQMGLTVDSSTTPSKTNVKDISNSDLISWYAAEAQSAKQMIRKIDPEAGCFEVRHSPVGIDLEWNQAELLAAAERSVVRKTGWPIGIVTRNPDSQPQATKFGVRTIIDASTYGFIDYWAMTKAGGYYFLRLLDEDSDKNKSRRGDQRWIYFDTRIWRVAEALLHCFNLYKELGVSPDSQISIDIEHSGLKNRILGVADQMRLMQWNRKCNEDESTWSKTLPLGTLEANLRELTKEATKELFVLFEFWQPSDEVFDQIFTNFMNSRI